MMALFDREQITSLHEEIKREAEARGMERKQMVKQLIAFRKLSLSEIANISGLPLSEIEKMKADESVNSMNLF